MHGGGKATTTILHPHSVCPLFPTAGPWHCLSMPAPQAPQGHKEVARAHGVPRALHLCWHMPGLKGDSSIDPPHSPLPSPPHTVTARVEVLNISNEVRTSFSLMMMLCG